MYDTEEVQKMNLYNQCELFLRATDELGQEIQLVVAAEECNELAAELMRTLRGRMALVDAEDEVADVLIIAHQLRAMIGPVRIDERVKSKMERFRRRVNAGQINL